VGSIVSSVSLPSLRIESSAIWVSSLGSIASIEISLVSWEPIVTWSAWESFSPMIAVAGEYPGRAVTPIVVRFADHHDAPIGGQCDSGRGPSKSAGADRLVQRPLTAPAGEHRDRADTPLVANPAHN